MLPRLERLADLEYMDGEGTDCKSFNDNVIMYKGDCSNIMHLIPDASIDIIMTDPPYLYTDAHWDVPFDEDDVFAHWRRIIKPDGFVCMFGRGVPFYRWGCKLDALGFTFKESVAWDKVMNSSPVNMLARIHEDCSIWSISGKIRKSRIKFEDDSDPDLSVLHTHVMRIMNIIGGDKVKAKLEPLRAFIETGAKEYTVKRATIHNLTVGTTGCKNKMSDEMMSLQVLSEGYLEKDIITVTPDHFGSIHATQKPVKLIERIMLLCKDFNDGTVLDCFSGSGSTGIACINQGRNFIGIEKDWTNFDNSVKRLQNALAEGEMLF